MNFNYSKLGRIRAKFQVKHFDFFKILNFKMWFASTVTVFQLLLVFFITICLCFNSSALAKTEQEKRFERLAGNYRCVVCQGQSVLDSDSEIAKEFKVLLQQKIDAGQTDAEIDAFFYERYGDFVFFNPKKQMHQYVLWGVPSLFFGLLISIMVTHKKPIQNEDDTTVS